MKKWIFVLILWALVGLLIHNQFDPNTVIGSVMGSAFIFYLVRGSCDRNFYKSKIKKEKMKNLAIIFPVVSNYGAWM